MSFTYMFYLLDFEIVIVIEILQILTLDSVFIFAFLRWGTFTRCYLNRLYNNKYSIHIYVCFIKCLSMFFISFYASYWCIFCLMYWIIFFYQIIPVSLCFYRYFLKLAKDITNYLLQNLLVLFGDYRILQFLC